MFDNLSEKLTRVVKNLRGQGRLSDENIQDALRDVRVALLDADVALPVVQDFIEHVRSRAVGAEVATSLSPGQAFIKIVYDELVSTFGGSNSELNLRTRPPAVIMLAGLQGSGKTTTAAKLARYARERLKKRVLLVSCDVYRPAAIEQLQMLAGQVKVEFFPSQVGQDPVKIAADAVNHAQLRYLDVVIVDTAGRLHIDEGMMDEAKRIHAAVSPIETLFVVDSMTGQDAANTARAFDQALPLTGVVLTKADGDARGGAALSIRHITGKPIKFMGVGEKTEALEPFYPDRLASRILDMGDVLTLVEDAHRKLDQGKAEALARKVEKGKAISLEDYRDQLGQMLSMGGMQGILDKLPGAKSLPKEAKAQLDDRVVKRMIAIINSMTPTERHSPEILKASRKQRIALGSGQQVQDVNRLLKQFEQTQKIMKNMNKRGFMSQLMSGRMPPGF